MSNFNLVLAVVLLSSFTRGVPLNNQVETNEINTDSDFIKDLDKCAFQSDSQGIANCASERLLRSLDDLSLKPDIEILPGVSLLSDGNLPSYRSGKQLNQEIQEVKSNHGSLLGLIGNATARFFADRTLKVKLPSSEEIGRALEEGRKRMGNNKRKGGMSMSMMGIGAAVAGLAPLFMGKIALMAGAALIIGKIAFILSAILLVQMFMGGKGQTAAQHAPEATISVIPQLQPQYGPPSNSYGPPATSYGVPSSQYPYSRSFNTEEEKVKYSQELAYSQQRK